MTDTTITIIGNLTADPELRYTHNGLAVANVTIASTPRIFDKASNEWKDGEALFLRASVWREFAEHVAASLTKGTRVVAVGKLKQRSFETKEGEKRTVIELDVDEIGPSLKHATAQVTRAARQGGRGGANGAGSDGWAQPSAFGAQAGAQGFNADAQREHVQGGWDESPPVLTPALDTLRRRSPRGASPQSLGRKPS